MIKLSLALACAGLFVATRALAQTRAQKQVAQINLMPDLPQPLKIIDFQKLTRDFDLKVFDFHASQPYWPLIWIDDSRSNFDQSTFGLYTSIGDQRQGLAHESGIFHESLTSMGAVLGASLVGVDKSAQDGRDFVGMLKNYFNRDSGWNIMQNNTSAKAGQFGGGYARDWWYDLFPNLLFYAIYERYPQQADFEEMARTIADQFYSADAVLNGDYGHSYFNYALMKPGETWICPQPDAAAAHAWVLYSAYVKFGDPRYLTGARSSLRALLTSSENPSYEVLLPFAAYTAARLNAELGESYDVSKIVNWVFEPNPGCRQGWGVLADSWNGYDVSGLVGNTLDHGGYGFLMDTYDAAWPLVPMVRYDVTYADAIGKWMLNAANAVRLMYPDYAAAEHQTLSAMDAQVSRGVIGYEGLVKHSTLPEYAALEAPVAQGDGPFWSANNPPVTQLAVYGSAHVGIFGSLIAPTEVSGVLRLDLLATDFFRSAAYPSYLYYNPYAETQYVRLSATLPTDLYDAVAHKFVSRNVSSDYLLELAPRQSQVFVLVPVGAKLSRRGRQLLSNGVVIDYNYSEAARARSVF